MKKAKKKKEKIDGLAPENIIRLRNACRQVWHWSYPKKLCVARATQPDGFMRCEKCLNKVPKVYVDHIVAVGELDGGFFTRLFCPSSGLQALCKSCHNEKTKLERSLMT